MTYNRHTTIPTEGLVASYDLDGNANDSSGNGNNGTATNVTWVGADKGYVEEVGSFNGSSSSVSASVTNSSEISINFWIKGTNAPSSSIYSKCVSYNNVALDFSYDHVDPTFRQSFTIFNGSNFFTCGLNETLVGGRWYMLTCLLDGASIKSYLNGVFQCETPYTGSLQTRTLLDIGRYGLSGGSQYYNGSIGLFKEYNKILLQDEINNLYNEGLRRLGPTNAPLSGNFPKYSLPNLEEGKVLEISRPISSGTYYDQTGNGNNGTPTSVTDSTVGLNNVMSFNGTSSLVSINDSPSLDITSEIYLSTRVNTTKLGTQYLIVKRTANVNDGYELAFSGNGKAFVRFNQNSQGNTYRLDSLTNYDTSGKWEKWEATYDGSVIKIYRNGVLDNSVNATFTIGTNNTALQLGKNTGGGYLQGQMCNPAVYNKSFTENEIQQGYYSNKII